MPEGRGRRSSWRRHERRRYPFMQFQSRRTFNPWRDSRFRDRERTSGRLVRERSKFLFLRLLGGARRVFATIASRHFAQGFRLRCTLFWQLFRVLLRRRRLRVFLPGFHPGLIFRGKDVLSFQIFVGVHVSRSFWLRRFAGLLLPRGFRHVLAVGKCRSEQEKHNAAE